MLEISTFLDVVVCKCTAVLKLLSSKDQALLVRRDTYEQHLQTKPVLPKVAKKTRAAMLVAAPSLS